jgi:hypothetical protein
MHVWVRKQNASLLMTEAGMNLETIGARETIHCLFPECVAWLPFCGGDVVLSAGSMGMTGWLKRG